LGCALLVNDSGRVLI